MVDRGSMNCGFASGPFNRSKEVTIELIINSTAAAGRCPPGVAPGVSPAGARSGFVT